MPLVSVSEFFLGGVAACGACLFTNPLEVVKTRMQLQGELKARGTYQRHYRNVFHAFFTIGRVDGILALQKGLVPALWYQLFMNGCRLGSYQCFFNLGLTKNSKGEVSIFRSVPAGALAGCIGAFVSSPFYMVRNYIHQFFHYLSINLWFNTIIGNFFVKKGKNIFKWTLKKTKIVRSLIFIQDPS